MRNYPDDMRITDLPEDLPFCCQCQTDEDEVSFWRNDWYCTFCRETIIDHIGNDNLDPNDRL